MLPILCSVSRLLNDERQGGKEESGLGEREKKENESAPVCVFVGGGVAWRGVSRGYQLTLLSNPHTSSVLPQEPLEVTLAPHNCAGGVVGGARQWLPGSQKHVRLPPHPLLPSGDGRELCPVLGLIRNKPQDQSNPNKNFVAVHSAGVPPGIRLIPY